MILQVNVMVYYVNNINNINMGLGDMDAVDNWYLSNRQTNTNEGLHNVWVNCT